MKKSLALLFSLLTFTLTSMPTLAHGNELEIGVVNYTTIQQAVPWKNFDPKLAKKIDEKNEQIKAISAKHVEEIRAEKDRGIARRKAGETFKVGRRFDFDMLREKKEISSQEMAVIDKEIKAIEKTIQKKYFAKIEGIIKNLAKEKQLPFVLQAQSLAYAGKRVDITQDVIAKLKSL